MNLTSLAHPTIQARIYAAMRYSVNAAYCLHSGRALHKLDVYPADDMACTFIKNKHGKDFLSVTYRRSGEKQGFRFYDKHGDVTALVLKSLRSF